MPPAAFRSSEAAALLLILGLTAWRLAWLPASDLELYVDEAQYWLWGQEMAAGAWSKPPLVGWLIRAANEAVGSDAPWVARLPWPLVHGAAALALMALGRRLAGPAVGALSDWLGANGFGAARLTVAEALGGPRERLREGAGWPDIAEE